MTRAAMLLVLLLSGLLPGCYFSVRPALPPVEPPPNLPVDVLLFTVPPETVRALRSPAVQAHLQAEIGRVRDRSPERADQVVAHKVLTGMTSQEVVWAFRAHPTRVVDEGPPGGHTLLWGHHRAFAPGRFWVRLNEWGLVTAAGRY